MIYDLLFFFIVIIIVLNLIFGVIIDTFADLRSEKQQKDEILRNSCFICGKTFIELGSLRFNSKRLNEFCIYICVYFLKVSVPRDKFVYVQCHNNRYVS